MKEKQGETVSGMHFRCPSVPAASHGLMKPFENPFADHGSFVHAFGFREPSHALKLAWEQIDTQWCVFGAGKHGFADLLQSLRKVREIMRVPELR